MIVTAARINTLAATTVTTVITVVLFFTVSVVSRIWVRTPIPLSYHTRDNVTLLTYREYVDGIGPMRYDGPMPTNPALKARVPDSIQRKGKAKAALLGISYGNYLAMLIEKDTQDLAQLAIAAGVVIDLTETEGDDLGTND